MKSSEYWKKREAEALKNYQKDEETYYQNIRDIYENTMDRIQKEIDSFYIKYAVKEDISLAEAKKRVSELDIKAYERKAKKYVRDKDFSDKANAEMRLYNATMKINRLELLKANIGLELVSGYDELQRFFEQTLTDRTLAEFKRQAGILGKTVQNNAEMAHSIVNASFHNATFSDRIWMHETALKNKLSSLLEEGLIQGRNPRQLAIKLKKQFGVSTYNSERLMRTELARVQTAAQKRSFEKNGFDKYEFIANGTACEICAALDGKHFVVKKMMPGENAPPMHPNCRCSVAAYEDSDEYEAWLDYLDKGGTTEEWNRLKNIRKSVVNDSDSGIIKSRRFNTTDDPMREVTGAAEDSNPKEVSRMIQELKEAGVEIIRRENAMGYSPSVASGNPGQLYIEEGASYSAWCHEFKHFSDDRDDGYLGFRVFQDIQKCKQREIDAYQIEIELARKANRDDIVKRLEELRDKEVAKYE